MADPYLTAEGVRALPEVAVIGKIIVAAGYEQDPHLPRIFRKDGDPHGIEVIIYSDFVQCLIIDGSYNKAPLPTKRRLRLEFSDPDFICKLQDALIPNYNVYSEDRLE